MTDEHEPSEFAGVPANGASPNRTADAEATAAAEASADTETDPMPVAAAAPAPKPAPASVVSIPAPRFDRIPKRHGLDAVAIIAMLAFVLVGGILVFGFAQAVVPAAEAQLGAACRPLMPTAKTGELPELELEDLAGNPVSLADFRGKFLVVNFWATWCQPCTREWPDLDILADRLSDRDDVAVIAISIDQEPELIAPYLDRMGLTESRVTILRAKQADAHKVFGSTMIPDTYFVNRDGGFEAVFVNIRQWGRAKAVRCVEASAGE